MIMKPVLFKNNNYLQEYLSFLLCEIGRKAYGRGLRNSH